jgi:hypothetical protein
VHLITNGAGSQTKGPWGGAFRTNIYCPVYIFCAIMQAVNGLDHFEALAEQLVEGTFEWLFRHRLHPSDVARRLARAMEDGQVTGDDGQVLLPNRYWVFLNSDDFAALDAGGEPLRAELTRYLGRLADEGGGRFGGRLSVALHPVADLASGQVDVRAAHGAEPESADDTHEVKVAARAAADTGRWSLHLGGRVFPLGEPVVRLGRALSNDVILDDRRVSRRHAQLRWRGGGYHLSDMGSSGGTTLNGQPVRQGEEVPLTAGDVVSLAGVTLTVNVETDQPTVDVPSTTPMPSA